LRHLASSAFWDAYALLPKTIRAQADDAFEKLKNDPSHPSLRFKKVGKFWSARVTADYRALAVRDGEDLVWFWIGTHADYDKLLR